MQGQHQNIEPVWCVVANVVEERFVGPGGSEVRRGTKHFRPGAKVYLVGAFWGMGGEQVTVIGQHRASKRYIVLSMASHHLTNWRPQMVYRPAILRLLHEQSSSREWGAGEAAKQRVHEVAEGFAHWDEIRRVKSRQAPLRDPQGQWMWALVARVVADTRRAGKNDQIQQFVPGSQVTLLSFPDMSSEVAEVTGRHRDRIEQAAESAYTTALVSTYWLCDWAVDRVQSRAILSRLRGEA